jgi:hypothetical protein
MNPLPSQHHSTGKPDGGGIPSLPTVLPPSSGDYSASNRRSSPACPAQRAYPWLLFSSTAVAALFCLLYITKPVIIPAPAMIAPSTSGKIPASPAMPSPTPASSASASMIPSHSALPGETTPAVNDPRSAIPAPPSVSAFEETNLRVQHVLTAEAPGGHLDRIVLDVPVLYRSRELRWTADEVARARQLLIHLMDYQEKCRALRSEGTDLLSAWNHLMEQSLPATELRADSPSLPANQQDTADSPRPAGLISTESIQISPAGK